MKYRALEFIDQVTDACHLPFNENYTFRQINIEMGKRYPKNMFDDGTRIDMTTCFLNINAWRKYKPVYSLDLELETAIMEMDDIFVPTSVLYNLPYKSIYIEIEQNICEKYKESERPRGIMATIAIEKEQILLFVVALSDDVKMTKHYSFMLNLTDMDNYKSLDKYLSHCVNNNLLNKESYDLGMFSIAKYTLNVISYLCSDNADIVENEAQSKIYKPVKFEPKDKYREIRKWDVGVRFGNSIRLTKTSNSVDKELPNVANIVTEHSSPRPHIRKAHWQHYHVGQGRNTVILKWKHPSFINCTEEDSDKLPITTKKIMS